MHYYLGIDNGGTTTKASIFDEHGVQIAGCGMATSSNSPRDGFVERDMDEMWSANCKVIRGALERANLKGSSISGIAVCGHGKGLYLWGKDDKPARPGIASTDARAQSYVDAWRESGVADEAAKLSCQQIIACQPPALLAWVKDNEPQTYSNIKYVFECKDYIRFMLTGNARAELSDYSGTSLMNLYSQQFDYRLFRLFGIPEMEECVPGLCTCGEVAGFVTSAAAAQTGLAEGTPVAGGFFDIDACAVGSGVVAPGKICMVAGTWSINEYVRDKPVTDGVVSKNSCFCLPGLFLIEESSPTSAGNNEWFIRMLLPDVVEQANRRGESVYEIVNQMVESTMPDSPTPIFLPFLFGSNVNPHAKGAFIGIDHSHTRTDFCRSVYEGITFCHRHHLERLLASMGEKPESIRLSGGAARSRVWSQMFADVLGLPVETVDSDEVGALGCAVAASVASGCQPDIPSAVNKMVREKCRYEPRPEWSAAYDRKYRSYLEVVRHLDSVWDFI